jgi:predicted ArsR family transcriptional regulator
MDNDSTRTAILAYIQTHRYASAIDIARSMNLTGAAVRYHLIRLRKAGLIEVDLSEVPANQRGRPAQNFRLAAQSIPHNLPRLATALLQEQMQNDNQHLPVSIWTALAARLVPNPPSQPGLNRRLPASMEQLNQMNYAARWEAGPRGPRVLFFNCPYAALRPAFPQLCQMDSLILQKLLGKAVTQTAQIAENAHSLACVFETIK